LNTLREALDTLPSKLEANRRGGREMHGFARKQKSP
jgi:hypothetical protein